VTVVPTEVRHYHRASRPPFLNLSDLDDAALAPVVEQLMAERRDGTSRRAFGRRYMELRRRTEERMRRLFLDAGGSPERRAPHYSVLGGSRWFTGLADDMVAVTLPIDALPDAVTSFTLPDSFTAMGLAPEYGLPYEPRPYHGRVYRTGELADVIARHGLPDDEPGGYDGYERRPFERYVEVQLWSDEPVRHLLRR
jgi:hypothetical protein